MAKDTNTTELAQEVRSSFIRVAIYCFLDQQYYDEMTLVHYDEVHSFIVYHPAGCPEMDENTLDNEIRSFFASANWYDFQDGCMNYYFAPPRDIYYARLRVFQSDWALDIDRYDDLIDSPHIRLEWFTDERGDPMGEELRDAIIEFRKAEQEGENNSAYEEDAA